jgi:hypothetical protein
MPVIIVPKFYVSIPSHRKKNYSISYGLLSCKTSDVVYHVVKLIFKLQARWQMIDTRSLCQGLRNSKTRP